MNLLFEEKANVDLPMEVSGRNDICDDLCDLFSFDYDCFVLRDECIMIVFLILFFSFFLFCFRVEQLLCTLHAKMAMLMSCQYCWRKKQILMPNAR